MRYQSSKHYVLRKVAGRLLARVVLGLLECIQLCWQGARTATSTLTHKFLPPLLRSVCGYASQIQGSYSTSHTVSAIHSVSLCITSIVENVNSIVFQPLKVIQYIFHCILHSYFMNYIFLYCSLNIQIFGYPDWVQSQLIRIVGVLL